ncbi:hypothetical protein [Pacificoceanicola onchidii]|uniref:hypothetical protein n=1 Tax=Pacificoceanicola onchidii TaxID=2562685 RepID=UPI0010A6B500|nr:hypothetical protein [Pacificoceanicola onchidii]
MRFAGLSAAVIALVLASGSAAYANSTSETIVRAFKEICVDHAPSFQSHKVKASFQKVGKAKFPTGSGAFLSVVPAQSCRIHLDGIPLNADGSEPDVSLALEKQIITELARRVGGEVSVYRKGKRNESWSVKVGRSKYRLQSIYKKRRQSWGLTLYKS